MSKKQKKKVNKSKYFRKGENIYPYASSSNALYWVLKIDVFVIIFLLLLRLLLAAIAGGSYWVMVKISTATTIEGIAEQQQSATNLFARLYNWSSTADVMPWVTTLIHVFGFAFILYLSTIALRHHHGELRPFKDDKEARRLKRVIKDVFELSSTSDLDTTDDRKKVKHSNKKYEREVEESLKSMTIQIHTRKEINGDEFKSICKVAIPTPKQRKAKQIFYNVLKVLPDELTDASDGNFVFGKALKQKDGKKYFFLAEFDCTEEYAEKIERAIERSNKRISKHNDNVGNATPVQSAYSDENSSWSIELLTDRSKIIENAKKEAAEEAKEIQSQVEMFMSSNSGVSAQLDNVKVSNSFVGFEYSIPKGKTINFTTLAEDIENFAHVTKPLISTMKGKLVISVPLTNTVMLDARNIIEQAFNGKRLKPLTAIFGGDSDGNPATFDLATSPHLLVVGTTGSGKSVGVNQIILTIMKHATPKQVQFLMIDPKMVELAVYKDSPYLMADPVIKVKDMPKLLGYTVLEQDDRYRKFSQHGVRNIEGYNKKMQELGQPELPHLVVVVDEMADMMMSAAKEVENYIIRIGQKARAAGIHLILATQTPRADVVTGLIKANIPTRIAYQVVSPLESRIALDEDGAEILVGKGDSFIKWKGARKIRVQSLFIDDDETEAILKTIREKYPSPKKVDFVSIYNARKDELEDDGSDDEEEINTPEEATTLFETPQQLNDNFQSKEDRQAAFKAQLSASENVKETRKKQGVPDLTESDYAATADYFSAFSRSPEKVRAEKIKNQTGITDSVITTIQGIGKLEMATSGVGTTSIKLKGQSSTKRRITQKDLEDDITDEDLNMDGILEPTTVIESVQEAAENNPYESADIVVSQMSSTKKTVRKEPSHLSQRERTIEQRKARRVVRPRR